MRAMAEEHTNRRLAAILAADVVGYSRMMGADEAGTLAALKRHREAVFDPTVAEHGGRVVKLIGDGTLVEFSSVVDAVNCALAIQRAVKAASPSNGREHRPQDRRQPRRRHHRRRRHLRRRRQRRRAAGAAGRARRRLRLLHRQRKRRQPHRRRLQGRRRGDGQEHRPADPRVEVASGQRSPRRARHTMRTTSRHPRVRSNGPRSPSSRSTTCPATPSRNISPTASPRTSSPTCPRSAA